MVKGGIKVQEQRSVFHSHCGLTPPLVSNLFNMNLFFFKIWYFATKPSTDSVDLWTRTGAPYKGFQCYKTRKKSWGR